MKLRPSLTIYETLWLFCRWTWTPQDLCLEPRSGQGHSRDAQWKWERDHWCWHVIHPCLAARDGRGGSGWLHYQRPWMWTCSGLWRRSCSSRQRQPHLFDACAHVIFRYVLFVCYYFVIKPGADYFVIKPKPTPIYFQWSPPSLTSSCKYTSLANVFSEKVPKNSLVLREMIDSNKSSQDILSCVAYSCSC